MCGGLHNASPGPRQDPLPAAVLDPGGRAPPLHVDRPLHEDDVPHRGGLLLLEGHPTAAVCRDAQESVEGD